MANLLRIILGVFGLGALLGGIGFMTDTGLVSQQFFIAATGDAGNSTMRGDLGGLFVAIGVFLCLGFAQKSVQWFGAAAILVGAVFAGRVVSLVVDGPSQTALMGMAIEALIVALVLGYRVTAKSA